MLTLFDQEYLTELYGEEQRREGRAEGRQEGRAEGRQEGRQEGTLNTLYSLVQKQILSVTDAAAEAEQSVGDFETGMASWAAAMK